MEPHKASRSPVSVSCTIVLEWALRPGATCFWTFSAAVTHSRLAARLSARLPLMWLTWGAAQDWGRTPARQGGAAWSSSGRDRLRGKRPRTRRCRGPWRTRALEALGGGPGSIRSSPPRSPPAATLLRHPCRSVSYARRALNLASQKGGSGSRRPRLSRTAEERVPVVVEGRPLFPWPGVVVLRQAGKDRGEARLEAERRRRHVSQPCSEGRHPD